MNAKDRTQRRHLPCFFNPKGNVVLEYHWTITKPIWGFNIDIEGIWERAKAVRKEGIEMLVFALEDLLLHLSLHATYQHNLRTLGLVPYCDIAAIIYNAASHKQIPHNKGGEGGCEQTHTKKEVYDSCCSEIDWDKLQARAHEWGISKYLNLSLCLSHEILGAKVPESILSAFRAEPMNKNTVSEAMKRILSVTAQKFTYSEVPYLFSDGLNPNNSIMRRMLFTFRRIFIPPGKLAAYYAKFYFYWLTHKKEHVYGENLDLWLLPSGRK